ncbi:MAG: SCO family protein [Candidatus Kapabacteria bacterium]|nr:SCO family protein [Candidatus Kapabacteria bacterium]
MKYFLAFLIAVLPLSLTSAVEDKIEVGIEHEKKLDTYLPLDLEFVDSEGYKRTLKDLIDKPVVLSLVYYHCPGICSPLLNSLGEVIDKSAIEPGKDYKVLTISFDPRENHEDAKKWKANYIAGMTRPISPDDWIFMAGDSTNIAKITDAVGFRYIPDGEDDFVHAGALIMIAPDGKITRYLLGTDYSPFDFKLAVIEASKGISAPPISKMLAYCFSYDPEGRTYVFNFNKVAGTVIFLGVGIFFVVLLVKGRTKKVSKGEENV